MNKKILIAGLLVSVMLLVPINSAYSNNGLSVKNNEDNLLYNTMLDDTWVKTYDYDEYSWEEGNCVCKTSDGGYIVVAKSYDWWGYNNDWIFKTDNSGNLIWDRTYTKAGQEIYVYSVIETNDNNYIITGRIFTWDYYDDYYEVWLLNLDVDGNKIWSKTYNFSSSGEEVIQTSDGGYAIVGYHPFILIKTYSNGSLNWVKTYDNDVSNDLGNSLKQTSDGGYIILGYNSIAPYTTWLLKTDENGTLLWDKKYNGKGEALGVSVDITKDGGYIITGETRTHSDDRPNSDIWILKTDSNGEKLWEKILGRPNSPNEGRSVFATDDGGCVVAGTIYVGYVDPDAILIKLDVLGNVEWNKTYGGKIGDFAESVKQTIDGGYILTGRHQPRNFIFVDSDAFLIKTDSNGNAPPLSKTKDIGIRNRVFDNSLFLRFLERYPLLNRLLSLTGLI